MIQTAVNVCVSALLLLGTITLSGCASNGLSEAAYDGNLAQAQMLLKKGADVNRYDRWGWTPLLWAVYYKHNRIVRLLLENGADPNIATKGEYGSIKTGSTPLIIAAYYGYATTVRELLEKGAQTGRANDYGYTALHYAEQFSHDETIGMLKQKTEEMPKTPDKKIIPEIEIIPH